MPHCLDCPMGDHRESHARVKCFEIKNPGSQEVDLSCGSHSAEDMNGLIGSGDINKHGSSSLWTGVKNYDQLNKGQVSSGGDDLTPPVPDNHVGRLHVRSSSAGGKVTEEGSCRGSTRQLVLGYTGMEARIGQLDDDAELYCSPVKRGLTEDSWTSTNCDMLMLEVPESSFAGTQDLTAISLNDLSKEPQPNQESAKPVEDMPLTPQPLGHPGMERNQACLEIGQDKQRSSAQMKEEELLAQKWPLSPGRGGHLSHLCSWLSKGPCELDTTAAPFTGGGTADSLFGSITEMGGITLWEMVEDRDDQSTVFACTIDDIFRVPQYCCAAQVLQPPEPNAVREFKVTDHTLSVLQDEASDRAGRGLNEPTDNPSPYKIIRSEVGGKEEINEILNVAKALIPGWQEEVLSGGLMLGQDKQPESVDHTAGSRLSFEPAVQTVSLNKADEKQPVAFHGDLSQVEPRSDDWTFELEPSVPLSFGGPLAGLISDPMENEPVCGVRTLDQELSGAIIPSSDSLILSKEDHVAYATLDLHDIFFHASSFGLGDVHRPMSSGHVITGKTDAICEEKGGESTDTPHKTQEMSSELNIPQRRGSEEDLIYSEADTMGAALKRPGMGQVHRESLVTCTKWTGSSGRDGGPMEAMETLTTTKNAVSEKETKTSQTQVIHKNGLLYSRQELCSEDKQSTAAGDKCPAKENRDKLSAALNHKKVDNEVGKERPDRVKEAPSVLRDVWAERDGDRGLRLLCLLERVTEDCSIVWSKDGAVLADGDRSTGDPLRVALTIAEASTKDLGTYRCVLGGPHGQVSSVYHLTPEGLSELVPSHCLAHIMEGVREDVKCAPVLFREDFLCEQYFGEHEAASIVTEGVHFGEGMHRRAFRTRLLDGLVEAFRPGQPCVLKVHTAVRYGTKNNKELVCRNYSLAAEECYVQNTARKYIRAYKEVAKSAEAFGEVPDIIPIYLVHRPSNDVPYATLEEELIGDFVKYSVRDGREVNLLRRESEAGQKCCAFQHWVYLKTEGNLLVTDMQGVGMKLTDVGIATCRKGYRGFRGNCATSFIDQFRALHQCNQFCALLGLPSLQPTQPKARKPGKDTKPKKKIRALPPKAEKEGPRTHN